MGHRNGGQGAVEDLGRSVAAALHEIRGVREERSGGPTRAARLTLVTVHGASRLRRLRERESLDA